MVYNMRHKSKNLNKRKYIKRQTKKRMYGGNYYTGYGDTGYGDTGYGNTGYGNNDIEDDDTEYGDTENVNTGYNKTVYNIPPPPPISHLPSSSPDPKNVKLLLWAIIEKLQAAGNLSISALKNIINIMKNNSATEIVGDVNEKIKQFVSALNTRQGKELEENIGKLGKGVAESLEPMINKMVDIAKKKVPEITELGSKTIITALNELPPVFAVNELSNLVSTASKVGETVAETVAVGAEGISNAVNKNKENLESVTENATDLFNNVNEGVTNNMNNTLNNNISKKGGGIIKSVNSLEQYKKEAKMIGGRVKKAHLDFLSPYINRGKILRQYGGAEFGKRKTQKRKKY